MKHKQKMSNDENDLNKNKRQLWIIQGKGERNFRRNLQMFHEEKFQKVTTVNSEDFRQKF